jgi:triosephosphate isomerase
MKIFIANWKMQLDLTEQLNFCQKNLEALKKIENKIILCPTAPALVGISQIIKDSGVAIGAQTCSEFEQGAYTGQVAAKTIAQTGCSYIIVGHSEERATDVSGEQVAQKSLRTLEAGLIPIICVGESQEAHNSGNTQNVLRAQLAPIKEAIQTAPAYIAYEPIWAIGSGKTPSIEELTTTVAFIKKEMPGCALLYGGSVKPENKNELLGIEHICGLLVGGASTNFEEFQKIVN